jgi:GNAT superfamily N-acetyltransferase
MYTYQAEKLNVDLETKMEAIARGYYESTPAHIDTPPYDIDWMVYRKLEEAGVFVLTTCRYDGWVAGFAMYIITAAPHHKTVISAECDSIVIAPEHRGAGIGRQLYYYTEGVLRQRGATRIVNRYKVGYRTTPLFEELGFKLIEHVYAKEIG